MSRPHRHAPLGAFALTVSVVSLAVPAHAQAEQTPKTPATPTILPSGTSFLPATPPTLKPLLDKVVWDPGQRGPLLIVAPERTEALKTRDLTVLDNGVTVERASKGPETDAQGNYRLLDLGDYFGRRVKAVGSVTVFAPTTMTVLATRLPKPDPYVGMGSNEKLRLFQSLLTPAQWRTMGSPGGIGIGDLDNKQRDLFLSLLPNPFVVQPVRRDDQGRRIHYSDTRSDSRVTLTPTQRQSVRLTMRRVLDWNFARVGSNAGSAHIGIGEGPHDGAKYELRGYGFGSDSTENRNAVFGVPLLEVVPSQLKPGQLPFDWSALDTPISLEDVATVGELMKRVATQARVPLYCDPRYADLSVYIRSNGRSVRAGDLLQALCWGVTGTFRKVGSGNGSGTFAYVLTDDVEGLGTRHARLQAWASTNAALAEQRRTDIEDALAKAPIGDAVGWADGDTQRPDDALSQKIEAHRKMLSAPATAPAESPAQQTENGLMVPVSELPVSAQETVRKQLKQYEESHQGETNPIFSQPLQADRVVIDVQIEASFIVPGMGTISSQGSGYSSNAVQHLVPARPRVSATVLPALPAPDTIKAIPTSYKQRALLITARTADEATRAVMAAQAHGLTQVWLTVPAVLPKEADDASGNVLAAAIAAGKKANVSVGAVIHLLRAPVGGDSTKAPGLLLDRNIVGETTAEFATRRAVAPPYVSLYMPSFLRRTMTPKEEAERQMCLGNWLTPEESTVQAVRQRVATIANTPGLAKLVLRDTAAPGYDTPKTSYRFDAQDGAEEMGYTQAMRLAFLRETGIDPVDISPLPQGQVALPLGGIYSAFLRMQLPFFPDYGPNPGNSRINDKSALELGAKDGPVRWQQFRAAKADAALQSTLRSVQIRQPGLPVLVQRGKDTFTGNAMTSFFDQATAATPSATPPVDEPTGAPLGRRIGRAEPVHSANALLMVRCAPLPDASATTATDTTGDFTRRLASLMTRVPQGWGGFVVDLSEVPLDRALPLLNLLPPSPPTGK